MHSLAIGILWDTIVVVAQRKATSACTRWLDRLKDVQGRARMQARIQRRAEGNPGQHRNLTSGLAALKIDSGPGYRVSSTLRQDVRVILLCGGDTSRQAKDMQLASE